MAYRALGFQRGTSDNLPQLPSSKTLPLATGDDPAGTSPTNRFTELVKGLNKKGARGRGVDQDGGSFTGGAAYDLATKAGAGGDIVARSRAPTLEDKVSAAKRRLSNHTFFAQPKETTFDDSGNSPSSSYGDVLSPDRGSPSGSGAPTPANRASPAPSRHWTDPTDRRDSSPLRSQQTPSTPGTPVLRSQTPGRHWTDPGGATGRILLEEQFAAKAGRAGSTGVGLGIELGTASRIGAGIQKLKLKVDTDGYKGSVGSVGDDGRNRGKGTTKPDRSYLALKTADSPPSASPLLGRAQQTVSPDNSYRSLPTGSSRTLLNDSVASPIPGRATAKEKKKPLRKALGKKARELLDDGPSSASSSSPSLLSRLTLESSSPSSPLSPISPISPISPMSPMLPHPPSAAPIESDQRTVRAPEPEDLATDEAVRQQTAGANTNCGRPIERAVSVHQRGPFKYELSDFLLQKTLGQGAFAKVYLVKRNIDGKLFALKSMRKDRVVKMKQIEHVQNERHLMEYIRNPFLVGLEATFQDSLHIYMIIDYMAGGDLFNFLKQHEYFEDNTARFYAAEVAMALSFLHSENIIYRDLKPENVLLDSEGHVKLGDFGFAKHVDGTTRTFCGTPSYIPPEILLHRDYTHAVDWWSFGILLFEMLSGCSPFQDSTCPRTYERILQGRIQWPSHRSQYFSRAAENLILGLLVFDPVHRLGCQDECEIRDHVWFESTDWRRIKGRKIKPPVVPGFGRQRSFSSSEGIAPDTGEGNTHVEISIWRSGSWSAGQGLQISADMFKGF
ncbi:camp-dependent protein kinase catalytic subunit [Rhizophlyctis rosea]|uniref:cAMP-dependent protein kinase n=1 Tax=Rhizophlyctis rosea TaxID=64517 RepID=A0AAD5WZQ5_9FUNG|nr:camp-dependent protein kinase catalytic subunit [Rhizophlyctis rosea]